MNKAIKFKKNISEIKIYIRLAKNSEYLFICETRNIEFLDIKIIP